jgi:hypothetical protein
VSKKVVIPAKAGIQRLCFKAKMDDQRYALLTSASRLTSLPLLKIASRGCQQ